ncbi:MAG: TRAP transporter small permease subunit [Burkholderiaceae bacterium]|nr:TRAP transporter small permease subunit [Burkholderiaceae bacterium]
MRALAIFVTAVGRLNTWVGQLFSWLAFASLVLCFVVVVERYVFATTHLWMQDLYVWLNGAMFMAVAGYTLLIDGHVRVDILYRPASLRAKAICDIVGVLVFLLPFCAVVAIWGLPYVEQSWALREASENPGGMPGLFVLKGFIVVFVVLVGLQGLAMLARSLLVLGGGENELPMQFRYRPE